MREARRLDSIDSPLSAEADAADLSLPGWIYHDREFFELEKQAIFRSSWQVVCHISDVPRTGDYYTLDFLGEAIIVVRGDDGAVRLAEALDARGHLMVIARAQRRQRDAAGLAHNELQTQGVFETFDLLAYCAGGNAEF